MVLRSKYDPKRSDDVTRCPRQEPVPLVDFDSISKNHVNFFVGEQKEDLCHLSLSKLEVNFFGGSERRTLVI